MPNTTDPLAYVLQRIDLFTQVEGEIVPVTAIIRQPFASDDESWLCAVSISGLIHRKSDVEGGTAEAALRDARKFVLDELTQFQAEGGTLTTARGEPVTDLRAAVFGA